MIFGRGKWYGTQNFLSNSICSFSEFMYSCYPSWHLSYIPQLLVSLEMYSENLDTIISCTFVWFFSIPKQNHNIVTICRIIDSRKSLSLFCCCSFLFLSCSSIGCFNREKTWYGVFLKNEVKHCHSRLFTVSYSLKEGIIQNVLTHQNFSSSFLSFIFFFIFGFVYMYLVPLYYFFMVIK